MKLRETRASRRALIALAASGAGSLALPRDSKAQDGELVTELLVRGLERPLFMSQVPGRDGAFLIVEQIGHIHLFEQEQLVLESFLDVSEVISRGSEQGLLGLALHKDFESNGLFYINYTDQAGDTQVVRYRVADDEPFRADPSSATPIISVNQPARNHNGGMIAFGPDGYLYVGLGDGGLQGDPASHGQNAGTLLGSILRLDVDSKGIFGEYVIPEDNPLVMVEGARGEIWSYGLRNPWRFSFDRETGDLWIGDVGENAHEEIDFQPAGVGGLNFGWNLAEGPACYADPNCEAADIVWPVFSYGRDVGLSVTGGYVYRGSQIEGRAGTYLCGDYGTGYVWALTSDDGVSWNASAPMPSDLTISSFAEDLDGELYIVDFAGSIYRIVGW